MSLRHLTAALAFTCAACAAGPAIDTGPKPQNVGGTISGTVSASGGSVALSGRKVAAIEEASGRRIEASTAVNGGYTLQVPPGNYRLELELRSGETLEKRPDPTQVTVGDIDSQRDFVVTAAAPAGARN